MQDYDYYHEVNEKIDVSYVDLFIMFVFFLCWEFVEHKWFVVSVMTSFFFGLCIGLLF